MSEAKTRIAAEHVQDEMAAALEKAKEDCECVRYFAERDHRLW
jgi:hypothetical protein